MADNLQGGMPTVVTNELTEFVAECIGFRWKKYKIKAALIDMLETDISPRSLERLMQGARKLIQDRSERPIAENKGNAIEFYEAVIADDDVKPETKIKAQERLDLILGIQNTNEEPPEDQAAKVRQLLKEADESVGTE